MRMPKWLVALMLDVSIVAVLTAGGWWWVTCPGRTMQEFVALGAAGRLDEARAMMVFEPDVGVAVNVEHLARLCGSPLAKRRLRTALDVVLGIEWYFDSDRSRGVWKSDLPSDREEYDPNRPFIIVKSVRAQRGKIVFGVEGPFW